MKNKNNISKTPLKNAPFLSKIKKENHFSIPKKYLQSLDNISNFNKLKNRTLKKYFDILSYRFYLPIAAIFIVFLIVFNFYTPPPQDTLTSDQIYKIISDENYIEIEDDLLYETYYELAEFTSPTQETNNEYIDYLIDNDIDIDLIITEL